MCSRSTRRWRASSSASAFSRLPRWSTVRAYSAPKRCCSHCDRLRRCCAHTASASSTSTATIDNAASVLVSVSNGIVMTSSPAAIGIPSMRQSVSRPPAARSNSVCAPGGAPAVGGTRVVTRAASDLCVGHSRRLRVGRAVCSCRAPPQERAMGLLACARIGESRRRHVVARCCMAALLVGLAACGGGNDPASDDSREQPLPAGGAVQAGQLPTSLVLAEPRSANFSNRIELAWAADGVFAGSIIAQIELGLSFAAGDAFELRHNDAGSTAIVSGGAHEFRYANGFFLLTALQDNDVGQGLPFGVDIYPVGVQRVPPIAPPCTGDDTEVCYTGFGFINFMDWPKRAGDVVDLLIPREDPAGLTYTVLLQPASGDDFHAVATISGNLFATVERGAAWRLDFPSARVKVRGCNGEGQC